MKNDDTGISLQNQDNKRFEISCTVCEMQNKDIKWFSRVIKYVFLVVRTVLYGCETWSLTSRKQHRLKIFENRELRRIFGPKREEDGSWRNLHNDELHSLYSSPNIVRAIKSRRMRWVEQVACEVFTGFWLGGPKVRDNWKDLGVGGKITLRWTLGR
jgi:hypothetical protein